MPGTGWPEPGGFLPREALKMVGLVAAEGLCGMEIVEVRAQHATHRRGARHPPPPPLSHAQCTRPFPPFLSRR